MAKAIELCPEEAMMQVAALAEADSRKALTRIDDLLRDYDDPRLLFLKGSLLASLQRYDEAVGPMTEAVEIAPAFHIARFQLGLLHLSSGAADLAQEVWGPLRTLEARDPLRLFAEGLKHMAKDEFAQAEQLLREGIALNRDHPAVNGDMRQVLDRIAAVSEAPPRDDGDSEAHWLLKLSGAKPTKH